MEAILLQETALQAIYELGLRRRPAEACGILLPSPWKKSWILEVPNRSKHCHDSFEYTLYDLRAVLHDWANQATPEEMEQLTLWHTHPSGGVGPSRIDMRNRIQGTHHLVVTLTDEGPVPSWY
jgi:proteasome lid subunit RPN8/RPN11